MRLIKKVKYGFSLAVFVALLTYLTYTGITGLVAKEVVNIPIFQEVANPNPTPEATVNIPAQADSQTQKVVDKFMQEFNIPLAKRDEFVQQAKDVINQLDNPEYSLVPPAQNPVDPESLDQCFERVIVECS